MTFEDTLVIKRDSKGKPTSWVVKNKKMMEMWERYLLAIDEIISMKERRNKWTGVMVHEMRDRFGQDKGQGYQPAVRPYRCPAGPVRSRNRSVRL